MFKPLCWIKRSQVKHGKNLTYCKNKFSKKIRQIHNFIVIESSWLGNFAPYEKGIVSSMIYEMMKEL